MTVRDGVGLYFGESFISYHQIVFFYWGVEWRHDLRQGECSHSKRGLPSSLHQCADMPCV